MSINDKYKTIREWAEAYRTKAKWNVVPLYHYSKSPANVEYYNEDFGFIPGWMEFEKRFATDKEFDYWFSKEHVTGLGVITGKISNLVVVDEDSYKSDGMKFDLITPMKSRTGRNGVHHFFKYTEPVKTSGFRKGVNIEVKSDGGFIVLPPSMVWSDPEHTIQSVYEWQSVCAFDKLPTITEKELEKYKSVSSDGTPSNYVELQELRHAPLGEQHNSIRTIALKMFQRFPQKDWGIAEEFIRKEAALFVPPHPKQRVDKIIFDCASFIRKNKKEIVQEKIDKLERPFVSPRTITEVAKARIEEKKLERVAPKTGYKELDNLIGGFVPGHLYTLTGDTNVGKSSICCNFVNRITKQGKKVLYFSLEPENNIVDYIASVRTGKMFQDLTEDDILFDDGNVAIYGKDEIRKLEDLIDMVKKSKIRYDVIFIDHIGYFIHDKKNYLQEQSNTIKELAWLAKEKHVAVVQVAHLRKKSTNQSKNYIVTADDISGSAAFKQDSTDVLIVTRDKDTTDEKQLRYLNTGFIWVVKTKSGPNGAISIFFNDRSALIQSYEELQKKIKTMSKTDALTAIGFPDQV